jgi:Ca2+/H+ antiporter, TMEM165/GDT1 family
MKKIWIKKGLMMATFFIAAMLFFTAVVMGLWNAILPAVLGLKTITFLQALGILVLSKILFGGCSGGWRGGRGHEWKQKMKEKWDIMTPDERDQLKAEWKNRCGGRWSMKPQKDSFEQSAE